MKESYISLYMDIAKRCAEMSYCKKRKVGAIIVKDGNIISMGWNGMPSGMENDCEKIIEKQEGIFEIVTKPECLHAEANAILKVARSTNSLENSVLFVTTSPCIECSKLIIQSKISKVYYSEAYKNTDGLELLKRMNIETIFVP